MFSNTLNYILVKSTGSEISDWINDNPLAFFFIIFGAIIFIAIISSGVASAFKKNNLKYSSIPNSYNKTGAEVAREILQKNGIGNVSVLISEREGTDHYNPRTNQIMLSPTTYNSRSIAAAAISAHEAGHAIQWGKKEFGIRFRDTLAKPVQIATQIGNMMFMLAFFLILFAGTAAGMWVTLGGLVIYGSMAIFQLATLPVEFGASRKAKKQLRELNYLKTDEEILGTKKVLNSAAMTYVVAFLASLILLGIFVLRLIVMSNRR